MSAGPPPGRGRAGCDPRQRVPRWVAAWWLPLALGTAGCAGTPWGETLSGSFPAPRPQASGSALPLAPGVAPPGVPGPDLPPAGSPPTAPPARPGAAAPGVIATPATPGPGARPAAPGAAATPAGSGVAATPASSRATPARTPGTVPRPVAPKAPPRPSPGPASPYRVTLRLPRADPSAPAEAVTEALRAAGISFEVETIERVPAGATPQAPDLREGALAPPAVRPAPLPR